MTPETEDAIRAVLAQGWVKDVHWLPSVDSTSDEARRCVTNSQSSSKPSTDCPILIVADKQTKGRGRGNHRWWSPSGCLMMTLVIDSSHMPSESMHWSQLALVVGLAVANTVEHFSAEESVQLKWPNDVYLSGKKCSGILIESGAAQARKLPQTWLIGIGLNVNMNWMMAPPEISQRATCISSQRENSVHITDVVPNLISTIECSIQKWSAGQKDWQAEWQRRCLLSGMEVEVNLPGNEIISGVCEGIDSRGQLLVRTPTQTVSLLSGEIVSWK